MLVPKVNRTPRNIGEVLKEFDEVRDPITLDGDPGRVTRTCVKDRMFLPLLYVLARELYPNFDEYRFRPLWEDGNWTNESYVNIRLEIIGSLQNGIGRPKKSGILAPSTSIEYRREYQRTRLKKMREALRAQNAEEKKDKPSVENSRANIPPTDDEANDAFLKSLGLK